MKGYSTEYFVDGLASDFLVPEVIEFEAIGDRELPDYLEHLSLTYLDNENKGAYFILDSLLAKVVIYASPSSAFSAPVYGNLILQ